MYRVLDAFTEEIVGQVSKITVSERLAQSTTYTDTGELLLLGDKAYKLTIWEYGEVELYFKTYYGLNQWLKEHEYKLEYEIVSTKKLSVYLLDIARNLLELLNKGGF